MKKFLALILTITFLSFGDDSFAKNKNEKEVAQLSVLTNEDFENYESDNVSIIHDPWERYNRKIYAFNDVIDRYFLEYVATAYREEVPRKVRISVRNFLVNLSAPISAINSLLQGEMNNSLATFSNFLINTTIGVGGIFNIAEEKGITYHREDFGQTIAHYGVGSGYYLYLPLFGPSSTRDFTGFAIEMAVNPLDFNQLEIGGSIHLIDYQYRIALAVATGVDKRERLINIISDIRADSFDPYATIRSAYLQRRISEIKQ